MTKICKPYPFLLKRFKKCTIQIFFLLLCKLESTQIFSSLLQRQTEMLNFVILQKTRKPQLEILISGLESALDKMRFRNTPCQNMTVGHQICPLKYIFLAYFELIIMRNCRHRSSSGSCFFFFFGNENLQLQRKSTLVKYLYQEESHSSVFYYPRYLLFTQQDNFQSPYVSSPHSLTPCITSSTHQKTQTPILFCSSGHCISFNHLTLP